MISVIVAVYNQLAVNKIFYENLQKYTRNPFELIIIDNNSTDGSREYYKSVGATVIENDQNYSYPYCQNQGIRVAKYDVLAFLNNDIVVATDWDAKILETMQAHDLDVITTCGIERLETQEETQRYSRRWKGIKNFVGAVARNGFTFKLMAKLMYGNWEKFCAQRYQRFGTSIIEGFAGNSVIMTRRGIEKVGLWDERIQAADFDLFIRSKKRHEEHKDVKPMHAALGVFNHHFIRITLKSKPPVFADASKMISLEDKWTKEELEYYKPSFKITPAKV
ncbi:glycosyltransferase family 2 protein [Pontibacter harenae]|uniref:glycosyltransferase family 2 protein n=1 Tax=Pontibacter harenae TaxID=2894083 RepID=UPI001E2C3AA2|nr:glycosyltransferase [Pontibacter harenae]MCC9168354.1 glycosyltransferase [Pontibacter harenae]